MNYEFVGIWHNRGFSSQIADVLCDGTYAFQERTYFPTMGDIFLGKCDIRSDYWMNTMGATEKELFALIASVGLDAEKYKAEPCKYGDGFFAIASSFDDAKALYEIERAANERVHASTR